MDEKAIHPSLRLIDESYRRWTGQPLGPPQGSPDERHRWLHESAPFMLLAHDNSTDHYFIYANHTAQQTFGYSFEEFLRIPSRLSAAPEERAERTLLIRQVEAAGITRGYTGIRVKKSGALFRIRDCVLWMIRDEQGRTTGMAAQVWPGENVVRTDAGYALAVS